MQNLPSEMYNHIASFLPGNDQLNFRRSHGQAAEGVPPVPTWATNLLRDVRTTASDLERQSQNGIPIRLTHRPARDMWDRTTRAVNELPNFATGPPVESLEFIRHKQATRNILNQVIQQRQRLRPLGHGGNLWT